MNKIRLVPIVLISSVSIAFAQTQISGVVLDSSGKPLQGVVISNTQSKASTLSNNDGSFSINAKNGEQLSFSHDGNSQKITVTNFNPLSIVFKRKIVDIDEVVVVGYGTRRRSDVTGAISSVDSESFNKGLVSNPGQMLQGKVAGVNVSSVSGEPGASQDVIIRGVGSLRSGTTPLYVVDGFALDNTTTGVPTNPLNFINPQDIEKIDVLKDASAAAIYGARAANGVIAITTKKGRKGKTQMNFSSSLGFSQIANRMNIFNADEFRQNVKALGGKLDDGGASTDWQKLLTRSALSSNVNFSMGGGTDNSTYYAALGYDGQEGILYNNKLNRYSGRVSLSQKAFDGKFNVDFNLSAARTENRRPNATSMVSTMLTMNPTYPAYTNGEPTRVFNNGSFNPLIRQEIYKDFTVNHRIIGNISPSFEFLKGLTYKLNLGADYSTTNRDVQNTPHDIPQEEGNLNTDYYSNKNILVENTLTYQLKKSVHDFSIMAGHSYQDLYFEEKEWAYRGFPNNGIEPRYQIGAATEKLAASSVANKNELQSYFGRLNYGYDNKYLLTATMRADGSSKFGKNNHYGYFPSVALAWNIDRENFLAESKNINRLKLRGSWGKTGNQEIPNKITQASYKSTNEGNATYPLDNSSKYPVGVILVRTANPDLQWEVTTQTNVGLDFGFFGNKLTGTVDYFNKVSEKILLEINPTDPITPTEKLWRNIDNMSINNSGFELGLDYTNRKGNGFTYSIGGNLAYVKNEVKNSPFKVLTTGSAQGPGTTGALINGYMNGQPIGTFYVFDFEGINDKGTNIFRDVNGDGQITDNDRYCAGSALPDLTYNFYLKLGYRNLDLAVNFNGVSGNMIYNNTASTLFAKGRLALSQNTTEVAIAYPNENVNNTNVISDRYLEKGDFLRLNNATLGYNLDPSVIGLGDKIKNIRFSLTGTNLFLITKYSGFDPEINSGLTTGGIQTFGIDYATYPKSRSFIFGVNVSF